MALRDQVTLRGLAPITGGGISENLPRVLPEGLGAEIDTSCWEWPRIFRLLQETGSISLADMRRTFNLGIGMMVIVPPSEAQRACEISGGTLLGTVIEGEGVRWL